ncbi:Fc receptor-like protein 5 [Amia ocellicauda]|uniref:Fc receptor-like protein 5 n=1 Tax=Amia ocellicauda TaxID=2972642 RepID=UPI0034647AF9
MSDRQVGSRPQAVLTADPPWTELYTGETVTLRCQVRGSGGWKYSWALNKDGRMEIIKMTSGQDGSHYILSPVSVTDSGQYWCQGARGDEQSDSANLVITVMAYMPQAVVTVDPSDTVISGETVTLHCSVGKVSAGWKYSWARQTDALGILESLTRSSTEDQQQYSLGPVTVSDSGQFLCQAERVNSHRLQSLPGAVIVKVSATSPKPLLILDPPSAEIYTGDKVTLSCGLGGDSAGWEYLWYRDTQGTALPNTDSSRTDVSSYTISQAALSHRGQYWCRATRGRVSFHSQYSDALTLDILARPQAVLTLQSGWTEMFTTENVTLRCEVQGSSTEWIYKWFRDGQELLPVDKTDSSSRDGDRYTILSGALSHTTSPKPLLTLDPPSAEIYTGDRVTLSCGLGGDSAGWEYLWYRDTQGTALPNTDSSRTDVSSYTISQAALSHSGQYWCRATRGRVSFHSQYSDALTLDILAQPQAVLTLQSGWTEMFTTERVTLRCEVQGSSTGWIYKWFRDGQELLPVDKADSSSRDGDRYTILSGALSHTTSPKPLLTLDPPSAEIYTGDRVTLSCGLGGDSAGWEYLWYRDTQGTALPNTDSSRTDGSSYTISQAALSHSGRYWCRATRGRVSFHSQYSDALTLDILARPQAVLTLESGWTEIFITDSLTLRCEVQGSDMEWNYTWYRDGHNLSHHNSDFSGGNRVTPQQLMFCTKALRIPVNPRVTGSASLFRPLVAVR